MQPETAVLKVDAIDKVRRLVTFVSDAAEPYDASLKALKGSDTFAAGSGVPIGKVTAVERKPALGRSLITVKISDATVWAKVKHSVYSAAQAKLYGDKIGSLNLIDTPCDDARALHKRLPSASAISAEQTPAELRRKAADLRERADAIPEPSMLATMAMASRLQRGHASSLAKARQLKIAMSRRDALTKSYATLRERHRQRVEPLRRMASVLEGLAKNAEALVELKSIASLTPEERVAGILEAPAFMARNGLAKRADGSLAFAADINRERGEAFVAGLRTRHLAPAR